MNKVLNSSFYFLLLLSLVWISCDSPPHQERGKVLLLCDDYHINNWHQYKDSFIKYDIPVSFFVSHFHQMDAPAIAKLHQLEKSGHEIAYHTLNHIQEGDGIEIELGSYLRTEIDSGFQLMRHAGFNPHVFAFPGDHSKEAWRDSLRSRFPIVRAGSFGYFEYWERRRSFSLQADKPDSFWCYDIGLNSRFTEDDNMLMMLEDVSEGKNIALLFHSFDDSSTLYTTPAETFFALIREFKRDGAEFMTVSEFYNSRKDMLHYADKLRLPKNE